MLEIFVSIVYFINKVFLLFNQRSGWIIGAIASSAAIIYFLQIELYIFCTLEVACFCIMIYGAIGQKSNGRISYFIYTICSLVTAFLLFRIPDTGFLEFFTSLLFMFAFVLLADGRKRYGWIALGLAHAIMCVITYGKSQYFFATLQAASVLVCAVGSLYPKISIASFGKKQPL